MAYIELVDYNEIYITDKPKKRKLEEEEERNLHLQIQY